MPQVSAIEGLNSFKARKRFGRRYAFGHAVFAEMMFGDDGIFGWLYGFGKAIFGKSEFGLDDELTGIYWTYHKNFKQATYRNPFFWPKYNPSAEWLAMQPKYTAAYTEWNTLTPDEKMVYHRNAIGKKMTGYNLFIKTYLQSH